MKTRSFGVLLCCLFSICSASVVAQVGRTYQPYQDKNGLYGFQEIKLDFSYGGKSKYPVRIKAQFEQVAKQWYRDICAVKKDGKWGYVNSKGKMVLPFQYEEANGRFVKMNGKWGTIDEQGLPVIPCTYASLSDGGALIIASEDGQRFGFIDPAGKKVIDMIYDACEPFDDGTSILKTAGGYSMRTTAGLAKVKFQGKWGMIDGTGRYFLYPKFTDIWTFFGNAQYTWFSFNGKDYGAIHRSGQIVLPTYFNEVGLFDDRGEAKVTAYEFNDGSVSRGVVSAVNQTYSDGKKKRTFNKIKQNYLTRGDSVRFGLLAQADTSDVGLTISRYNVNPSGYAANEVAHAYLRDSLNQASVKQGIAWLKKGMDKHQDQFCAIDLGNIYLFGWYGFPKDERAGLLMAEKAMNELLANPDSLDAYLGQAEDADMEEALLDIFYDEFIMLSEAYLRATGTTKDVAKGLAWLENGVATGNHYCSLYLANLYFDGAGPVARNYPMALKYYEQAGEHSYAEGLYKAGMMYIDGLGTAKDKAKGVSLLKRAADLHHLKAAELLKSLGEGR